MTFALHSVCNPGNFTPISWTIIRRTFFLCQLPYELNTTFKTTQVIFYVSCVTHILFLTKVTISLWNLPGSAAPKPRQQAGDIAQQLRLLQVLKTCFVQSQIWFSLVLHVLTEKMDTLTIFGYSHAHLLESLNTQYCCKTNKPAVCNSCGADMSRELSLDDCFTLMRHRSVAHRFRLRLF